MPGSLHGQGFQIPRDIDLAQVLKPLWEAAPAAFLAGQVSVFRLRMKVVLSGKSYWMQPTKATKVVLPPRRPRPIANGSVRSSGLGKHVSCSSEEDTGTAHSKDSVLPDSNSDGRLSFASTADASLEEAADSESAAPAAAASVPAAAAANDSGSGESDGPRSPRAAAHTHTIWQNDYFILTDNRHYPNLKMRIRIRWLGPAHLGSALSSKTLMPINFGDSRDEPEQVILVLKAWMLHRWLGNDLKFVQKRSRRIAWEHERDALARAVRERGGRGSLHANALSKIEMWAPSVLDA